MPGIMYCDRHGEHYQDGPPEYCLSCRDEESTVLNATVIIQARMGSKRLPGKVLAPLRGKPVIAHVLNNVLLAKPAQIIFAISDLPEDEPLRCFLDFLDYSAGIFDTVQGDSKDVLKRFFSCRAAIEDLTRPIVRITCDTPLLDHKTIQWLVREFPRLNVPYLGLTNSPDGNDVEVFSFATLKEAHEKATDPIDREHVTPYMKRMPGAKEWRNTDADATLQRYEVKYSVDTVEDLEVCGDLLDECGEGASCGQYIKAFKELYGHQFG